MLKLVKYKKLCGLLRGIDEWYLVDFFCTAILGETSCYLETSNLTAKANKTLYN